MEAITITILFWLLLLTAAQLVIANGMLVIKRRWHHLEARENDLALAERMQQVLDLMQRHQGQLHKDIHRAALLLVDAIDNDPLAKERHFTAVMMLKAKLAQQ